MNDSKALSHLDERGQAHVQICISQSGTVVEQRFVVLRLAKRSDNVAFDGRVGADEYCALGFGIECAEPLQCP